MAIEIKMMNVQGENYQHLPKRWIDFKESAQLKGKNINLGVSSPHFTHMANIELYY